MKPTPPNVNNSTTTTTKARWRRFRPAGRGVDLTKVRETQTYGPITEVFIAGHFPMSRERLREYNGGLTSGPFRAIDEVTGRLT